MELRMLPLVISDIKALFQCKSIFGKVEGKNIH